MLIQKHAAVADDTAVVADIAAPRLRWFPDVSLLHRRRTVNCTALADNRCSVYRQPTGGGHKVRRTPHRFRIAE